MQSAREMSWKAVRLSESYPQYLYLDYQQSLWNFVFGGHFLVIAESCCLLLKHITREGRNYYRKLYPREQEHAFTGNVVIKNPSCQWVNKSILTVVVCNNQHLPLPEGQRMELKFQAVFLLMSGNRLIRGPCRGRIVYQ